MTRPSTPRRALLAALTLCGGAAFAAGSHHGPHGEHAATDSAIGQPGVAARASRSVRIDMNDRMRFSPERLAVRQGETVRLVVRNTGQVAHELSLGTLQDLLAHRDQMARQPGMAHAEPNQITLAPGQQGEIVWHFSRAGTVHFACLIPGHYEAGMRGEIQIRSSGQH